MNELPFPVIKPRISGAAAELFLPILLLLTPRRPDMVSG